MTTVSFIIPSKKQGNQFIKLKARLYKTMKENRASFTESGIIPNRQLEASYLKNRSFQQIVLFSLMQEKLPTYSNLYIQGKSHILQTKQYLMHQFLMHYTNNPPFSLTCLRCQVSAWTTKQQHVPSLYNQRCNRVHDSLKRVFNSQEL
jgi:hypothetical protein